MKIESILKRKRKEKRERKRGKKKEKILHQHLIAL